MTDTHEEPCGTCRGRGEIKIKVYPIDDDAKVFFWRRVVITCPTCHGTGKEGGKR